MRPGCHIQDQWSDLTDLVRRSATRSGREANDHVRFHPQDAVTTSEPLSGRGVATSVPTYVAVPFLECNVGLSMRLKCGLAHEPYLQCNIIFQTYLGVGTFPNKRRKSKSLCPLKK